MPHSFGYRARTRDKFSRPFRQHGSIPLSTYMRQYKMGDHVDIVVNSAQQKGMPHRFYHGRTGIVFNVSKRAIGVEVNKVVRNRVVQKRVNVRVEHVRPSKCRQDFLDRVKKNELLKREAKKNGTMVDQWKLRRRPEPPREGYAVSALSADGNAPITMRPAAFDEMV